MNLLTRLLILPLIMSQTDNIVLCPITVGADNVHAKSSCAPPNQYNEHANHGSQCSPVLMYTLVVHNVVLY